MAEIKSTMELVMERAARMGKATDGELEQDTARKKGMKLAAEFLDGTDVKLLDSLTALPGPSQVPVRRGMVDVLLRNIFLHRDEDGRERTEKAARGVVELGGGAGDLSSICSELLNILGQYNQHREQLKKQMEEQIRMQYEQVAAQQGGIGQGDAMNIELALQAKVGEEWSRLESDLNSQYNQALEQHKAALRERLL